jgi:diguanylate cyclase (GGDEF)-like protein/PAS domain S-box-containing protein
MPTANIDEHPGRHISCIRNQWQKIRNSESCMTSLLEQRDFSAVSQDNDALDAFDVDTVPTTTTLRNDERYLSHGNLTDLLESSTDAVILYDNNFRFLYTNAEAQRQLGYERDALMGRSLWEVFPEAITLYGETLIRAMNERIIVPFERKNPVAKRWNKGHCYPVIYKNNEPGLAIIYSDVTANHEVDRAQSAEREALNMLNCVTDSFLSLDSDGVVQYANPQAEQLSGAGGESLVGQNIWEKWPVLQGSRIEREYQRVMETGDAVTFEFCFEKSGRWLEIRAFPSLQGGLYAVFREITERKAMEAEQQNLLAEAIERADRDPLTGLLNHRAFYERLNQELERRKIEGGTVSLILMDVDHFKFFNEAFGHLVGDDVLIQIAQTLRDCCRKTDTLGRLGGDEFAIMVVGSAERIAWEIRSQVQSGGFLPPDSGNKIPLGCSLGIASYPDEALSAREMVALADLRLSSAKRSELRKEADGFFENLRKNLEGFSLLDALVTAVDNKDRYTRNHSESVVTYSQLIAERLEMSDSEKEILGIAALLHDVGKIGIPDRILRRPGNLSPTDYEIIKKHPAMSAAIIGAIPGMEKTLPLVHYHHEAWDGSGYPTGLAGEAIPLGARILAVADAYSAITTDRPYRTGMSRTEAHAALQFGAGKQWDARIVQIFLSILDEASNEKV